MKLTHVNNEIEAVSGRVFAATMALRPDGVLGEIAAQITSKPPGSEPLTTDEAADVFLPRVSAGTPRWELLDEASERRKELLGARVSEILEVARKTGILQIESIPSQDLDKLNPFTAEVVVQSGANRTPVIRPELARRVISDGGLRSLMWEPVGDRTISRLRKDGALNPEYKIAREIAPGLPDRDVDEYEVKKAVIEAYDHTVNHIFEGDADKGLDAVLLEESLYKGNGVICTSPLRLLMRSRQGKGGEQGLQAGLTSIHEFMQRNDDESTIGFMNKSLVLVTNGQYRTAVKMQALDWAKKHEIPLRGVAAFGDEAGFTVNHLNRQFVTAERGPMVYANEIVVIHRLGQRLLSLGS